MPGITSLQHLASDGATCLVLTTGDIIVVQAETSPGEERIKIIGTVDDGIEAAEWSVDKESLAIVSSAGSLLLFDLSYDLLSETVFTPEDLKASKAVSVGWGKKETQFQGKRTRTLRDPTVPEMVDSGAISSSDDGETTISWRGDSGFLAVSSRLGSERRVIRVFSREGILDGVSEAVDGLEAGLSWRPEGNIIAGIQREASRLRVIFFERNGLRHGEFDLRLGQDEMSTWGRSVRLSWNHSSTVLAVQFVDRVQLWTMGNYHYYLKQEIFHSSKHSASKMIGTIWHPESDLCLGLYDAG